jgi:hypothetical protein
MDTLTILPTDQPTDEESHRGTMHVPLKKVGYLEKSSRKVSKIKKE